MSETRIDYVKKALVALTSFLAEALPLLECHNVDYFYHKDMIPLHSSEKVFLDGKPVTPAIMLEYIGKLAEMNCLSSEPSSTPFPSYSTYENMEQIDIGELVEGIGEYFLSSMNLCNSSEDVLEELGSGEDTENKKIDILKFERIMKDKKAHEVEHMSDFVNKLAAACIKEHNRKSLPVLSSTADKIETKSEDTCFPSHTYLVDVGSGKGDLGSYLNSLYGYNILGLDISIINTYRSTEKTSKIKKIWPSLMRRAKERQESGAENEKRGKRWKRREKRKLRDSANVEGSDALTTESENCAILEPKPEVKYVNMRVNDELKLRSVLIEHFPTWQSLDFGVIGLHTCGGLAVDTLNLFLHDPLAKFVCVVPCCYQLLKEETDLAFDELSNPVTFPVSKFLQRKNYTLGSGPRMFAAYSVNKIGCNSNSQEFPFPDVLIYRSLFQCLLWDKLGSAVSTAKVGRIKGKFRNFVEYVHQAVKVARLSHLGITTAEIETVYKAHEDNIEKFKKFILLKVMFAPLVEAVILLDQLLYLLEKPDVKDAFLVQVFDPSISPRCHAVVAVRDS